MRGQRVRLASRLAALSIMGLMLSGCLGYDGDIQHGYQMDPSAISQLKVGEPAQQVLVALGSPSTTSTVGGGAWYYISQNTVRKAAFLAPTVTNQRILAVYFDKNKRVERIANYGLKDGKVFDFLNRTTPTGGNDESFLRSAFKNLLRF
ncbi:MAG TPA: outer membrane protein assembly factor BamE [Beijerinckiaceae bacterium]|nr:outer membrane protein assembly factor BamE [Beijerinckiaceae bacterium]